MPPSGVEDRIEVKAGFAIHMVCAPDPTIVWEAFLEHWRRKLGATTPDTPASSKVSLLTEAELAQQKAALQATLEEKDLTLAEATPKLHTPNQACALV